ncbi:MAG: energy-coupling factor transporter transmembrane component T [Desulfobacterales bacterium]
MAELNVLGFKTGDSLLHQLDVRFKLMFFVLICISSLKAHIFSLTLLTLVLAAALIQAGLPIKSALKDLRYIFLLLLFVFIARSLTAPGSPVVEIKTISVTREGLYEGGVVCWRLVIVIMTGLSFVLTTRPSEIKAAVEWILKPFPWIPAQKIATMMSLTIRFFPVIFDQAKETLDAQRARGVENRKNPIYRLKMFGIPLMRRTFERADKIGVAMTARCYSENRTDPRLSSGARDWAALAGVVCLCLISMLI